MSTASDERYDRSILLFGAEGQKKLRTISTVIVGASGLGSPLAEHLALLGVRSITPVDDEELDNTNRNRFVGARANDPVPGSPKVMLVDRLIREINPDVQSMPLRANLVSHEAFAAVRGADWIFGCLDDDGPRAILNELCAAYGKPYVDLASDVPEPGVYGGRVCVATGQGCLHCLGQLDQRAVRRYVETDAQLGIENQIYGISKEVLKQEGPSVSPINGVVAALAATEFMVAVTGLRNPTRLLEYRGWESKVVVIQDQPRVGCVFCAGLWGKGAAADVERYLKIPRLRQRRRSASTERVPEAAIVHGRAESAHQSGLHGSSHR
jgi:molybdopterin/thiamine biosynthesis adenylyltransferase